MKWTPVARVLQKHGSLLAPVFFLLGVLIVVALPTVAPLMYKVDENAVGHYHPDVPLNAGQSARVTWDRRLVRGARSPGSEVIAVYVNTNYSASVIIGNALIESLKHNSIMSADVLFFFVSTLGPWPLPSAPTRSALVINVSSIEKREMCVHTQGEDGTRPNQDLLNVAVRGLRQHGLTPCYLCDVRADGGVSASPLEHSLLDMKQSILTTLQPQPWHTFGTHSVNTIAFSTPSETSKYSTSGRKTMGFFQYLITTLNGLDERFHHSTFMWFSSAIFSYLQYDVLQFATILFVASIVATSYSVYQLYSVALTPLPAILWFIAFGTHTGQQLWGPPFAVATAVVSIAALMFLPNKPPQCTFWMTINSVSLCLMLILHPAVGLLAGGGTALQMLVLHEGIHSRVGKCAGMIAAWCVVYLLCIREGIPLWSMRTLGSAYISLFVYPNTIWVSVMTLSSILTPRKDKCGKSDTSMREADPLDVQKKQQ